MSKHLKLYVNGLKVHPLEYMRSIGIKHFKATPQTLYDSWWFWCCENIPDPLPDNLQHLNVDLMQAIGYGLSEKDALEILKHN